MRAPDNRECTHQDCERIARAFSYEGLFYE